MVYNEAVADQQIIDNFNRAFAMVIALGRMETHRSLHRELIEKALMLRKKKAVNKYYLAYAGDSPLKDNYMREYNNARDELAQFISNRD